MAARPKFDYTVKRSSFKRSKLFHYIHSQENVDQINCYVNQYGIKDEYDMLLSIESSSSIP